MLVMVRAGVIAGVLTMIVSLWVNWTQFPTFQFHFNYVLIGLTVFGVIMFAAAPWLWLASTWRINRQSLKHSAD